MTPKLLRLDYLVESGSLVPWGPRRRRPCTAGATRRRARRSRRCARSKACTGLKMGEHWHIACADLRCDIEVDQFLKFRNCELLLILLSVPERPRFRFGFNSIYIFENVRYSACRWYKGHKRTQHDDNEICIKRVSTHIRTFTLTNLHLFVASTGITQILVSTWHKNYMIHLAIVAPNASLISFLSFCTFSSSSSSTLSCPVPSAIANGVKPLLSVMFTIMSLCPSS